MCKVGLRGALFKRKDWLGKVRSWNSLIPVVNLSSQEEAADTHAHRTYYFRKIGDVDNLVQLCNSKLAENPANR